MISRYTILFSIPRRYIHKYIFNMDKAYFRYLEDSEQFHFSFRYENRDLKVDRQFNFTRQIAEPVSNFLTRVETNVEKVLSKKNKKKNPNNVPTSMSIQMKVNGEDVSGSKTCKEVFKSDNVISLNMLDKTFTVLINYPWIDAISLPISILATYPVYPYKLEIYNTNLDQSEFIWYNSKDKKGWSEYSRSYFLTPENCLVDSYLKLMCIPKNENMQGPAVEVETQNKVEAGPGVCPFELRQKFTKERATEKEFRVVTYNILADLYCDSDYTREELHPYCPPYALKLDYRKQLILKELMGYNADIICLQEVDRKVFKYDLKPFFSYLNFDGTYAIKGGDVAEGVATFFRTDKFSMLESNRIVLSEHIDKDPLYSHIWSKVNLNPKLVVRILDLKTTLQTVLLQSKNNGNELLLVANTHLYFHPDADHIRLLQAAFSITYIQEYIKDLKEEHADKRISLVFCGDFNSVPECGIYKLFTTGFVPEDYVDYRSNQEEAIENLRLEQHIHLSSACGTPQYTNFTTGFADCLDYIFYENEKLKVNQVVPLPSNEELTFNTALPSIVFPSDHIALISDLEWIDCNDK